MKKDIILLSIVFAIPCIVLFVLYLIFKSGWFLLPLVVLLLVLLIDTAVHPSNNKRKNENQNNDETDDKTNQIK